MEKACAVSIHAPTWGATVKRPPITVQGKCFNPRAHVGRDLALYVISEPPQCFNPRAHVGRDAPCVYARTTIIVSIHAPTWGATMAQYAAELAMKFQSTRPRGARLSRRRQRYGATIGFNPRAHVGRDHKSPILSS